MTATANRISSVVSSGPRPWNSRRPYCRPVPKGLGGGQPFPEIPSIRGVYDNRRVTVVFALKPLNSYCSVELTAVPVLILGRDGLPLAADCEAIRISAIGLPGIRIESADYKMTPPYVIVSRIDSGGISVERYDMPDGHLKLFPAEKRGTSVKIPLYV